MSARVSPPAIRSAVMIQTVRDARDELTYHVKRETGKAMAVVSGVGALLAMRRVRHCSANGR